VRFEVGGNPSLVGNTTLRANAAAGTATLTTVRGVTVNLAIPFARFGTSRGQIQTGKTPDAAYVDVQVRACVCACACVCLCVLCFKTQVAPAGLRPQGGGHPQAQRRHPTRLDTTTPPTLPPQLYSGASRSFNLTLLESVAVGFAFSINSAVPLTTATLVPTSAITYEPAAAALSPMSLTVVSGGCVRVCGCVCARTFALMLEERGGPTALCDGRAGTPLPPTQHIPSPP
jgi:hypothetical protein